MEITDFGLRILFLFLPGILCSIIVDMFTVHKERTSFQYSILSFVYGILSYVLLYIIYLPFCADLELLEIINKKNTDLPVHSILQACGIAILMGLFFTWVATNRFHFEILQKLSITHKFADLDVWGHVMNSDEVEWIVVRDFKQNLVYEGYLEAFSDNSKDAELLLSQVKVYHNDSGNFLYDVKSQYLSLDKSKISIEQT